MPKRSTIGDNPLDAVIPAATNGAVKSAPRHDAPAAVPSPPRKVRATFHIPEDVLEAARDAAVALSGPPHRLTLATLAETALRNEIERLRDACHDGRAFPTREPGTLRGGRPIGR
jgi:hypothetical protein